MFALETWEDWGKDNCCITVCRWMSASFLLELMCRELQDVGAEPGRREVNIMVVMVTNELRSSVRAGKFDTCCFYAPCRCMVWPKQHIAAHIQLIVADSS